MLKADSILKGTALLTLAGLVVKILGAVYRIPLARLIGAEGIGLYQMAYPIYLIFLSFSNAGIPIAVSRLVAEQVACHNPEAVQKTFRAALVMTFCLGLAGALGMAGMAQWLATHVLADSRAVYTMWALAPAIFFMSLMAALRGFFQGWQQMWPSAFSQVVEQIVRVAVALILAVMLLADGLEHAAAGAAFGGTAGALAGLVYLIIIYWQKFRSGAKASQTRSKYVESYRQILGKLVRFALPVSVALVLMPLLQTLDTVILPGRLQAIGYTINQATAQLGVLGNSWAVVYLPLIVTSAIAANLVPALAGSKARHGEAGLAATISEGLRWAVLYLLPVAIVVGLFGKTIYRIIYGEGGISILVWFAPAVFFLGFQQVTASVLQGLGKPNLPLINFTLGALLKILVTVVAVGCPGLNLAGAALGTTAGAGATALLNYLAIKRQAPVRLSFKKAAGLGALGMLLAGWYLSRICPLAPLGEFLLVSSLALGIYLVILRLLGGISPADLEKIKSLKRRSKGK